ncbi:hypothetical protein [Streptomyces olivochromogenes]|uniref:Uncharacterized protein n=1 Tax=Streptomyces olivochromogenes TaxID=1963 RepID=A0A250V6A8_STROL|nr:hypothetical protein [Streptomyces olivochromogenes]KUN49859.1 hypothetical protein AQJ27_00460 [Streptomyces olivochromogenes]GAX49632.1 hypothetical protein SO3561_01121 [Streptomyces olivochromogenes]
MDIHWAALGGVFGVSLGITLLTVVLFSLGVAAQPRDDGAGHGGARSHGAHRTATATAVLCFCACLAVAVYGLTLIIGG